MNLNFVIKDSSAIEISSPKPFWTVVVQIEVLLISFSVVKIIIIFFFFSEVEDLLTCNFWKNLVFV